MEKSSQENKVVSENKTTLEVKSSQGEINFINLFTDPKRYTFDDYGAGVLFADTFADRLRYVPEKKSFYHYADGVWGEDISSIRANQYANQMLQYLRSLVKENIENEEFKGFVENLAKHSKRKTMIAEARSINPMSLCEFDNNPYLLNCKNCTLDLSDGIVKRLEHSPEHRLTRCTNVTYAPEAKCVRWETFSAEVMVGDMELQKYLQKSLGYALCGDTSKECFFLLYGPKTRNGKGTTCETMRYIMGDYGQTFSSGCLSMKNPNSNTPSPELSDLVGVRFANVSEPQKGQKLNVALIKQLTGGDMLKARALYQNSIEYRPQFKLFINTNHLLEIDDDTIFSSSRLKMIPFLRHFDEKTRNETLKVIFREPENVSGIFNWLLKGYELFKKEGLNPPKKAVDALTEYRRECDTIALFMEQRVDKLDSESKEYIKTGKLFEIYRQWCNEGDIDEKSQKDFVKALRDKNLVIRHNTAGHIVRGYKIKEVENTEKAE